MLLNDFLKVLNMKVNYKVTDRDTRKILNAKNNLDAEIYMVFAETEHDIYKLNIVVFEKI